LDPQAYEDEPPAVVDLDSRRHRDLARRIAEESLVLLSNDGILPLADPSPARVAVIGPNSDRAEAMLGCYSFPNHVLPHHPDVPTGIEIPTVAEALGRALGGSGTTLVRAEGCTVEGP